MSPFIASHLSGAYVNICVFVRPGDLPLLALVVRYGRVRVAFVRVMVGQTRLHVEMFLFLPHLAKLAALHAATSCCDTGDHLQLRPKAEVYRLTKESRKGFDLDVSMFERVRANIVKYFHMVVCGCRFQEGVCSCRFRLPTPESNRGFSRFS